jgi:hypothetical protein
LSKKPFENKLDGCSKSAADPLDDTEIFQHSQEQIIAADIAFQNALDHAITMKLERCSTSPSTELGTRSPVFIPHDYY